MKTLLRFLSVVLVVVAITVASVIPAQATSSYDDFDFVTEELRSSVPLACGTANHSIGWEIDLSRELEESQPDFFTRWTNAQSHGWYLVLEDPPFQGFEVYYGTSPVRIEFITVGGERRLVLRSTSSTDEVYSSLLTRMPYENCQLGLSMSATHHIDSTNEWGFVAEHSSEAKVFVSTLPVVYPSGYDGPAVPSVYQKGAAYVAMGDSFSSGEGNPPFEWGTEVDGTNECHRSGQAYPRLLANDSALDLGSVAFVACSGATTASVLNGHSGKGNWNEGAQVNALSTDTEVVTITIGGNDVGFEEYAYACTIKLCGPGSFDYNYVMDEINDADFRASLVQTYETTLTTAPNAQVYVVGYPYMAVESSGSCWGSVDLTGAWAVQSQLNAVIESAVDEVEVSNFNFNIHYIDPNEEGSPFEGMHLCNGGETDFNGLSIPLVYSFHPNSQGQLHYKEIIAGVVD